MGDAKALGKGRVHGTNRRAKGAEDVASRSEAFPEKTLEGFKLASDII